MVKLDWNGDTNVVLISKVVASSIPGSVAIVAASISSEITITKTYFHCALHNLCIEHSHSVINIYYLYFVIIIIITIIINMDTITKMYHDILKSESSVNLRTKDLVSLRYIRFTGYYLV